MRSIIISVILSFVAQLSFGQIAFYRQYSSYGYDFGQGVVQLEDSSYVVTGASSSFTGNQTEAFLLKVDSVGDYIWSNHYGGPESDWGRRVLYKQGFGYFICGFTNSYGNGGYDYYLVKVDENGVMEWDTTYGGYGWEKVHDAVMTADTGVVMVGETSSNSTDNKDVYIVRTDKQGDTLWTKTIGGAGHDIATSVELYQDTTIIVAGHFYVEDSLKTKPFIYQYHVDGSVISTDTLLMPGNMELNDIIVFNDTIQGIGNYYWDEFDSLTIFRFTYRHDLQQVLFVDTSSLSEIHSGELLVRYSYNNRRFMVYYQLSGGYQGGADLHVGMLNYNLGWFGTAAIITHDGPDIAGQVIETSDGGVLLTGYTSSEGFGGANVFLCKIGPDQTYPTTVGVSTYDELVKIDEITVIENLDIYPNPANAAVHIRAKDQEWYQLEIYNSVGALILKDEISGMKEIDVSSFANGFYQLLIQDQNGNYGLYKMIVQH